MNTGEELIQFIKKSPTAFHAAETARQTLEAAGFSGLREGSSWENLAPGGYYVTRNSSSLIAFRIPEGGANGFQLGAAHSDSPTFRVKAKAEWESPDGYTRLNVEPYGGGIFGSWVDRPLSVAGRLVVRTEFGIRSQLVNVDRDLLMIPQMAIHMNREVNKGYAWNAQTDMAPVLGSRKAAGTFRCQIAEAAGVQAQDILSMDLFLYCRTPGAIWGADGEFVSAPRLDDLQCAFALLHGFLQAEQPKKIPVYALFDNEEVGSLTKQGADSTFLEDVLRRLAGDKLPRMLANSFLISADNAHAVHPAHPEVSDPLNRVYMNEGIVIKFNGNQKYTTDGISEALFRLMCERAGVACQTYTNRSDMAGGSTLGNISNGHISVNAADIGLAQLAMHSCYETAGVKDTEDLIHVMKEFYNGGWEETQAGEYTLL